MGAPRKILFLDIDGVLNSREWYVSEERRIKKEQAKLKESDWRTIRGYSDLDPKLGAALTKIYDSVPGLEIVISSTWRLGRSLAELRDILSPFKIPRAAVIGATPRFSGAVRGVEIQSWLKDNADGTASFVILDDDSDMALLMGNLVKTDNAHGLTDAKAAEVIARFAPKLSTAGDKL